MSDKTKKKIEARAGGAMTDYQKARDEAAEKQKGRFFIIF